MFKEFMALDCQFIPALFCGFYVKNLVFYILLFVVKIFYSYEQISEFL